jgi:hypothetical protein
MGLPGAWRAAAREYLARSGLANGAGRDRDRSRSGPETISAFCRARDRGQERFAAEGSCRQRAPGVRGMG